MKNIPTSKKGFTLIELIVVMAIISILTSLLLFNYLEVNKRARDNQRKSDLQQIRAALELYRSDVGTYPYPMENAPYQLVSGGVCGTESLAKNGTTYMQKVPCDPTASSTWNGGKRDYYYYSASTDKGFKYTLAACIENANDQDSDVKSLSDSPSPLPISTGLNCPTGKVYVLTNP